MALLLVDGPAGDERRNEKGREGRERAGAQLLRIRRLWAFGRTGEHEGKARQTSFASNSQLALLPFARRCCAAACSSPSRRATASDSGQ